MSVQEKKEQIKNEYQGLFDGAGENTTKAAKILWTSHILKSFLLTQTK